MSVDKQLHLMQHHVTDDLSLRLSSPKSYIMYCD
jgi:hypothetical protein